MNSLDSQGGFYSHNLKEISHVGNRIGKTKQLCLHPAKANTSNAILQYKHQQKRTYGLYFTTTGRRPNRSTSIAT